MIGVKKNKILHVVLNSGPTNMGFNEFHKLNLGSSDCLSFQPSSDCVYSANGSIIYLIKMARSFARHYSVIHLHSQFLAFIFSVSLLLTYPVGLLKCVYTVHTSKKNLSLKNYIFFLTALLLCRKVIACSSSSYESFNFILRFIFRNKFSYITNGVYFNKESISVIPKKNTRSIISVGRFIKLKRPNVIVDVLNKVNEDFDCVFIGDGELLEPISKSFKHDERFSFLGLVPRKLVIDHLKMSQIFISASSVEGMPISALEAAASGCFLLLSDIPSHREIAQKIQFCCLFKDDFELKHQIILLLKMPNSFFHQAAIENSRIIESEFSIQNMILTYNELYKTI